MMTLQPFPTFIQLRNWQIRAEQTYHELDAKNFLAYVTPGAGKTIFSLKIAHNLLSEARIRDVFVVVHTDHLRNQWLASAKRLGVPIKVFTYQEIAKNPEYISTYVMPWRGSLVIFDEIHHAADDQQWGDALGTAFKKPIAVYCSLARRFVTTKNAFVTCAMSAASGKLTSATVMPKP